jgi:hypothetical protein
VAGEPVGALNHNFLTCITLRALGLRIKERNEALYDAAIAAIPSPRNFPAGNFRARVSLLAYPRHGSCNFFGQES